MTDSDLTLEVLRRILAAAEHTNAQLDQTNARLEQTNTRLDRLTERVDDGFDQSNKRFVVIEHALVDVGAQLTLMSRYLKNRTEVELEDVKLRLAKLEAKVG